MKRKSRSSLFFVWAFAILACLVLVLFALIFSSCGEGAGVPVTTDPARSERAARRRRRDRPRRQHRRPTAPSPTAASRAARPPTRRTPPPSCSARPRTPARRTSTRWSSWATARPTASSTTRSSPAARTPSRSGTPESGTLTLYNYATGDHRVPRDGRGDKHSRRGDSASSRSIWSSR